MLTLAPFFSDHAVLQANRPVRIWGTTAPNTIVCAELNNEKAQCTVSTSGYWQLTMPPMSYGGPYVLTIQNPITGDTLNRADIMLGEVWLASGQSNMTFQLCENQPQPEALSSRVRMFTVPPAFTPGGGTAITQSWELATDSAASPNFSAVAYYFAERLAKELKNDITIGVIHASVGGSDALSWVSEQGLLRDTEFANALRDYRLRVSRPDFNPLEGAEDIFWMADHFAQNPLPEAMDQGLRDAWYAPDFSDGDWDEAALPASWDTFTTPDNGTFWFRKTITLPDSWKNKGALLSIGAADKQDITYVNGVRIGQTGTGYQSSSWNLIRRYVIPAELTRTGQCTIAVRVYSYFLNGGLIGPADAMYLSNGTETISLAGNWKYRRECSLGIIKPPEGVIDALTSSKPLPFYLLPYGAPCILFENMIEPLTDYSLRGVIWFQGEHNTGHRPESYERLMKLLIADWRYRFGQPDLPFHQVSLANYKTPSSYQPDSAWAPIRQIQTRLGKWANSTAIPAYDCGDAQNIHFPDKRTVGARLALATLEQEYGAFSKDTDPVALLPTAIQLLPDGHHIEIATNAKTPLHASDGDSLFQILTCDGTWQQTPFVLDGTRIRLVCPKTPAAKLAIRYAWADNPHGAIVYNSHDVPLVFC